MHSPHNGALDLKDVSLTLGGTHLFAPLKISGLGDRDHAVAEPAGGRVAELI